MKRLLPSWDTLLLATVVLIASVCAQAQQQVVAQEDAEGKVVVLDAEAVEDELNAAKVRIVEEAVYWIGIRGRSIESPVLRTHLQLADDMGVVVEEVLPGSPSDKAGLRKHDILLRVNNDVVHNMQVLQEQVHTGKAKPLELQIVRLGKKENVVIVPETRPDKLNQAAQAAGPNGAGRLKEEVDIMRQLMKEFGARNIGPGVVFRGGGQMLDLNRMPSGISVSIQRQNEGPAKITVKKEGKTWQVDGDDDASIQQLPDDVQPFVQRMLQGQNGIHELRGALNLRDLEGEIQGLLPGGLRGLNRREEAKDPTQKRIDDLERKLQVLMKRLEEESVKKP